jgi:hypothetical protein
MIEVRLFGDLRRYAPGPESGAPPVPSGVAVHVPAGEAGTVGQVLAFLDVDPDEVGNLFLNGRLVPRSLQAVRLGYPLAKSAPLSPEDSLDVAVEDGDRVGVFGRKMCLLVV